MRFFTQTVRPGRIPRQRQSILTVLLALGLLSSTALGQINESYTNLHDANEVYGINHSEFAAWTNSQTVTLLGRGETNPNLYSDVSFTAYGIYSFASSLTNVAAIDVSAVGGSALDVLGSATAFVHAYGIFAETEGAADVSNSASITVTALGGAAGSTGGDANAHAWAYGIVTDGDIVNSGEISVTATGGTADTGGSYDLVAAYAVAYGLQADGYVLNSGDITVTATGGTASSAVGLPDNDGTQAYAEAFGIQAFMGVQNEGDIIVSATGGTADSDDAAGAGAQAYGIYNVFGEVNNAGNITVMAEAGSAFSEIASANAAAYGIRNESDVVNSGNITVIAETDPEGEPSEAYGIYMEGGEGNTDLTNTGTIRAFGDTAFELYVAGTTTIVDTYNVTLDGNPEIPSIFVDDGALLVLNNATLTVTEVAGSDPCATQFDTPYRLFGVAGEGFVSGNFGDVDAVNPDLTAVYDAHNPENAADDTVALTYAPEASETLASASVEKRVVALAPYAVNQHMTHDLMYEMLEPDDSEDEDTGDGQALTACQQAGGMFFQPHYSYIEKDDSPLGYNASLTGASAGYTQCVNESLLGLHFGYGRSNIDYTGDGYSANTEDQDIVTSGFSGLTRWKPWILRYGFTGFHGWHDYHGLTGVGLTEQESAEFNSYGGTGLVMIGHTFQRKQHIFLPEIGANWLWVHRESFTTEATNENWDTSYSTLDDHDVWGQANLHWQSLYRYKKLKITPSASIGIHQLLTDGETEVKQSIDGAAPVVVEDQQDRTALALASGVVLRGRHTALTFAYDGEYSSDIEEHNFWVKFKLRF